MFSIFPSLDSAMALLSSGSLNSIPPDSAGVRTSDIPLNIDGRREYITIRHGNGSLDDRFAIQSGNVPEYSSLTNLLDCCILYYYAVAHKYIIMVHIFSQRTEIVLLSKGSCGYNYNTFFFTDC